MKLTSISYQIVICLLLHGIWYLSPTTVFAQVKQVGHVTLQNSGRKPLSNVQVRAIGAIPAESDAKGHFTLQYNKARQGQLLLLDQVYKAGYELVNERALSKWVLSSSGIVPIVMCPSGTLIAAQQKYYDIGRDYNMTRYAEACDKLEKQLHKNAISIAQYNTQLDSLSSSLQRTMSQLEEYAYNMACYNHDDLNTMSEQALALVEKGCINEALSLYATANLTAIYKGLNAKISRDQEEMNAMIPSLHLNADVYLFAGGEENLQKAEEIYKAIALSDTTNATNLSEYGKFLSEQRVNMSQAKEWWIRAVRHSTDSLQLAELYAGIAMSEIYEDHMHKAFEHLKQSIKIYTDLTRQTDSKDNDYLNMSYAITYCITECRYWLKKGEMANAVRIMLNGIDYAHKALQKNPEKYVSQYSVFVFELTNSMHELFVQTQQKTDKNLEVLKEMNQAVVDLFNITEQKEHLKMANWLAGSYLLLATACANWGHTNESITYADSCNYVIEQNKKRNPVLFANIEADLIIVKGMNMIAKQEYIPAADYAYKAYSKLKSLPYAAKGMMQALHILALTTPALEERAALEYSNLALNEMRKSSHSLTKKKMYDIYYVYTYLHAIYGKELPACENVLLEMIRFIDLHDIKREWITDENIEDFFTPFFALYHKKIVSSKEHKLQVIEQGGQLLEKYIDLKEGYMYRLLLKGL